MDEKSTLGIFDSGVGGLSVLMRIRKVTDANAVYFGDCLRAPYGNRPEKEIVTFIREILFDLRSKGVTHYISACNSMSVLTTSSLLAECGIPESNYVDMVQAFKKHAVFPEDAVVFVAATQATIKSGEYERALSGKVASLHNDALVTLAGLIEEDNMEEVLLAIRGSLKKAAAAGATHYVYACTHYPLVDHLFKKCAEELGWKGEFVDPAIYVAKEVRMWGLHGEGDIEFHTSKMTDAFRNYTRASIEP